MVSRVSSVATDDYDPTEQPTASNANTSESASGDVDQLEPWLQTLMDNRRRWHEERTAELNAQLAESERALAESRARCAEATEALAAALAAGGLSPDEIAAYLEERARGEAEIDAIYGIWYREVDEGRMPAEMLDEMFAAVDAYEADLHEHSSAGQQIPQPQDSAVWRSHMRELCRRWPREMCGRARYRRMLTARAAQREVDAACTDERADEAAADAVDDAHTCWRTSAPPPPLAAAIYPRAPHRDPGVGLSTLAYAMLSERHHYRLTDCARRLDCDAQHEPSEIIRRRWRRREGEHMSELHDGHDAVADLPRLLTPREAAEVLRRSPRTLRRWERQGLVRAVRPAGGDPVYERAEIMRLIREGRRP